MRSLLAFVSLVLAALAPPSGAALAQSGPTNVQVERIEIRQIAETVPVFAQITTSRDGSVASRVAGNVADVHVLAGDKVESGDLLVALDRELLQINLDQAEAQLAEARAGIETARVQVERTETAFGRIDALRGSSSFSQGRFDEAQSDMLQARSELVRAEARLNTSQTQLAQATYELNRSRIIAPFSGTVIEVNTIPGAFIQAGEAVVRLLDTSAFEVEAGVPSRFVPTLVPGQQVEATLEDGEKLRLTVRAVLPLEDPATRTRTVRFSTADLGAQSAAAVGQSLTVQVAVGAAREVPAVPKDALVQSPEGWTVFVNVDGVAEARIVEIGVPMGDRYEVLSGVAPDEEVVVRGNERLRPGQAIDADPVGTN